MLFGLFGKMTAVEGQRDALAANLLRAADLMKAVPGCLLYVVSTSETDPLAVWVTEIWRDATAHGASLSMPGVRDLINATMPLLAGAPEGTRFTPVGGKGLDALGAE
ncbi:MAG: antibiotic biosynthesis monooxygenase [Labilithrix sp.]|nr:antibiotic biosynthesis monooxygenase [Labilithrix sp.]MBX3221852.1 antibiotic biosynthesis monooxygenase [Labilithrix sp.]